MLVSEILQFKDQKSLLIAFYLEYHLAMLDCNFRLPNDILCDQINKVLNIDSANSMIVTCQSSIQYDIHTSDSSFLHTKNSYIFISN